MPTQPMSQKTYDAIVKINPDFAKPSSRLHKAFVYKHNLLLEQSGKPNGKGINETYPNYNSDEGVRLAQKLQNELSKEKADPKNYRAQLYEGAQYAKENMEKGDKPYNEDKANAFFMRKGTETIPEEDGIIDENSMIAPYKKEVERTGVNALKFPMKGRELKPGVDPKSYEKKLPLNSMPLYKNARPEGPSPAGGYFGMAKPPIGNGAAMPGSDPGISKDQFAKNDGNEMQKKMKGFKFNSLMT